MNAARKKNSSAPLDKVSENQSPDHMAELKGRVAALEKDVAMLKELTVWPLLAEESLDTDKKKKRGVKERIGDEGLFNYRDGLINWLEPVWPWMEDRLVAAKTAGEIEAVLEAVAEVPELRPDWQERLLQNAAALLEFSRDERFRKTELPSATVTDALTLPWNDERGRRAANQFPARQIANAMAGVPDVGWRRSLDRCSKQPSTIAVALNTDMYYRDRFGIPAPKGLDLTGLWSRVPKFLQPVLIRSSNRTKDR